MKNNQLINNMDTNETPETAATETKMEVTTENVPALQNNELNVNSVNGDEPGSHKLTDEQFIAEFELNQGLFTQTAESIQRHYGIKYTRQAVAQRAYRLNRTKDNFRETAIDSAKEILFEIM